MAGCGWGARKRDGDRCWLVLSWQVVVNRHKVTTLQGLVSNSRADSAGRLAWSNEFMTHRACNLHGVAKKHSRDSHTIRYARTYLALEREVFP
jgi:hypothetical protein